VRKGIFAEPKIVCIGLLKGPDRGPDEGWQLTRLLQDFCFDCRGNMLHSFVSDSDMIYEDRVWIWERYGTAYSRLVPNRIQRPMPRQEAYKYINPKKIRRLVLWSVMFSLGRAVFNPHSSCFCLGRACFCEVAAIEPTFPNQTTFSIFFAIYIYIYLVSMSMYQGKTGRKFPIGKPKHLKSKKKSFIK